MLGLIKVECTTIVALTFGNKDCIRNTYSCVKVTGDISWIETSGRPENFVRQVNCRRTLVQVKVESC